MVLAVPALHLLAFSLACLRFDRDREAGNTVQHQSAQTGAARREARPLGCGGQGLLTHPAHRYTPQALAVSMISRHCVRPISAVQRVTRLSVGLDCLLLLPCFQVVV